MRTSQRGLIVVGFPQRQLIPWDQVERVALMQNGNPRVVVHAYAGSVIIDRVIDDHSAQKRFTDFTRSVDQLHQSRQMASPSAAEASVNQGTRPGDSDRLHKADLRAQSRLRAELHAGTGVQLNEAGTAATTYWTPDPTGAHDLRLIVKGRWTPMVVTAGVPGSDPALSGSASFEWIGPATAPTRTTTSEWSAPGSYVFRSQWKKRSLVSTPIWYSTVWKDNRPIYLIEDSGRRFTAVDSGTSYPAARRSRTGSTQPFQPHRNTYPCHFERCRHRVNNWHLDRIDLLGRQPATRRRYGRSHRGHHCPERHPDAAWAADPQLRNTQTAILQSAGRRRRLIKPMPKGPRTDRGTVGNTSRARTRCH